MQFPESHSKRIRRRGSILMVLAFLFGASLAPAALGAANAPLRYPNLFGTHEVRSDMGFSMFPRWASMLARHEKEKAAADLPCASATRQACRLQQWLRTLDGLRDKDKLAQIREVNRRLNAFPYVKDGARQSGGRNHWATLGEFLDHSGDCEDYAIAKFMSLRHIGFSNDDLRVVVLRDINLRLDHAVVVVYLDGQALVLDNQARDVVRAGNIRHYRPYYSINETTWWLHVPAAREPTQPRTTPTSAPAPVAQRAATTPTHLADTRLK